MFEKFTERARKVMALANQEACRCNHEYIDTGHILIALLEEGSGVGATVLKNLGADLLEMRSELEEIDKPGSDMVTLGRLPQTPQAKKAIEYALEEAQHLKHSYVGTEHILLGLLRQPEKGKLSTANKILRKLEIKPKEVRKEVMNLLGEIRKIGKKKERPVKCRIFKFDFSSLDYNSAADIITKFLSDGKEVIQVAQSLQSLSDQTLLYVTIFYKDKGS